MKQIITPVLGPQAQKPIRLKRDMDGCVILQWGDSNEYAKLQPREAYDMAVLILKAIGCQVGETHQRPDDIGGGQLRANIKIA